VTACACAGPATIPLATAAAAAIAVAAETLSQAGLAVPRNAECGGTVDDAPRDAVRDRVRDELCRD
jgi:hypothetical protein